MPNIAKFSRKKLSAINWTSPCNSFKIYHQKNSEMHEIKFIMMSLTSCQKYYPKINKLFEFIGLKYVIKNACVFLRYRQTKRFTPINIFSSRFPHKFYFGCRTQLISSLFMTFSPEQIKKS